MRKLEVVALDWATKALDARLANEWVYGQQGKIYFRYNSYFHRIDISSVEIKEKYQNKGLFKKILSMLCELPVKVVRVENILTPRFAKGVMKMQIPGRSQKHIDMIPPSSKSCCVTVDLIQE